MACTLIKGDAHLTQLLRRCREERRVLEVRATITATDSGRNTGTDPDSGRGTGTGAAYTDVRTAAGTDMADTDNNPNINLNVPISSLDSNLNPSPRSQGYSDDGNNGEFQAYQKVKRKWTGHYSEMVLGLRDPGVNLVRCTDRPNQTNQANQANRYSMQMAGQTSRINSQTSQTSTLSSKSLRHGTAWALLSSFALSPRSQAQTRSKAHCQAQTRSDGTDTGTDGPARVSLIPEPVWTCWRY